WVSGGDLPGGGDTGQPVGPPSSFNVGPGQIPSDVYQRLIDYGLLPQGATDVKAPPPPSGGIKVSALGAWTGSDLMSWLRALGPLGAAAILGPLLGGALGYVRTGRAADQVVSGIGNANQAAQTILGGQSPFAPFQTIGNQALGKLGSFT